MAEELISQEKFEELTKELEELSEKLSVEDNSLLEIEKTHNIIDKAILSLKEKKLKINHGNISRCCKGEYKHTGGYIFKKETDKSEIKKIKLAYKRPARLRTFSLRASLVMFSANYGYPTISKF